MNKDELGKLGEKMRRIGAGLQKARAECDAYDRADEGRMDRSSVIQAIGLLNSMVEGCE